MSVFAGIDYSLSCPAICVYDTSCGSDFCFKNTKAFFRSNLVKFEAFREGNVEGCNHGPWKDEIDRFDDISNWAMDILKKENVDKVFLEGYAFAARGRVFNIAENTAVLKYNMWEELIPYQVIPPKRVKKFATGSGNASKGDMYDSFCKESSDVDLRSILTPRSTGAISPLNDIVDAYYILKYGIEEEETL